MQFERDEDVRREESSPVRPSANLCPGGGSLTARRTLRGLLFLEACATKNCTDVEDTCSLASRASQRW